jgi:hypothetical protein
MISCGWLFAVCEAVNVEAASRGRGREQVRVRLLIKALGV